MKKIIFDANPLKTIVENIKKHQIYSNNRQNACFFRLIT